MWTRYDALQQDRPDEYNQWFGPTYMTYHLPSSYFRQHSQETQGWAIPWFSALGFRAVFASTIQGSINFAHSRRPLQSMDWYWQKYNRHVPIWQEYHRQLLHGILQYYETMIVAHCCYTTLTTTIGVCLCVWYGHNWMVGKYIAWIFSLYRIKHMKKIHV
mgnify:CR=1 FL=1